MNTRMRKSGESELRTTGTKAELVMPRHRKRNR